MTGPGAYDLDAERRRVLEHAVRHVPFDGWSDRALAAGAADAGMAVPEARLLFPRGGLGMALLFAAEGDRRMIERLEGEDLAAMRVRERVTFGVRSRLEADSAHREAVRRALALMALPGNVGQGLRCGYRTVDAIWHAVGDTSTDFNFYTKRALLGGVYSTTVLYWLDDESEGFEATWGFLDRRIGDVMKIQGLRGRFTKALERLISPNRESHA